MISSRRIGAAVLGLLGVLVAPSCATTAPSGTDSNTHWLDQCRTDKDCGSLVCQCGACTKPCTAASECKGLGAAASCGAAACATGTKVCVETCATTADCPEDGRGLRCIGGQCAPGDVDSGAPPLAGGVCPDTIESGAPCASGDACTTACAGGWQSHYVCSAGQWLAGHGLLPCGPDGGGGVADGGGGGVGACPPGAKGGDLCSVDQAECWTPCLRTAEGAVHGNLFCGGGQWIAGKGLFPCDLPPLDAGSGKGPCAPMDAVSAPGNCSSPWFKWDGKDCVSPVVSAGQCGCSGADCGALYVTEAECRVARAACSPGFSNSCTSGADCQLAGTACCRPCGEPQILDTVPLNVSSVAAWGASLQCGDVGCPPCMGPPGTIQALCQAGTCTSVNLAPYAPCLKDDDCVLRAKDCCECGDLSALSALVAINGSMRDRYAQAFCDPAADCAACTPQYPLSVFARCQPSGGYCYATWAIP